MSADDVILKPEELFGGFDAFEVGDETFAVSSMNSYPGKMPVFDDMIEDISEEIPEEIPEEAESANDVEAESIPESIPENDENLAEEQNRISEDIQAEVPTPEPDIIEGIDLNSLFEQSKQTDNEEIVTDEESAEAIDEFEALKRKIAEGIQEEIEMDFPEHLSTVKQEDTQSEEQAEPTESADVDTDSDSNSDEIQSNELIQELPKNKRPKNQKKQKSVGKIMVPAIICILLLCGAGVYFLNFGLDSFFEPKDTKDTTIAKVKKSPIPKAKKEIVPTDSVKIAKAAQIAEENRRMDSINNANIARELALQNTADSMKEVRRLAEKKQNDKLLKIQKNKVTKTTRVNGRNIAKNTSANRTKTTSTKDIFDPEIYVIQVYASPSKNDATQWLKKVQNKVGSQAYISTQIVRDQVWYRVRCGHYQSKEEAANAARKYGFSQSWIDRVK